MVRRSIRGGFPKSSVVLRGDLSVITTASAWGINDMFSDFKAAYCQLRQVGDQPERELSGAKAVIHTLNKLVL